jgi:formylglycine-generating enzyme required for sulfatase activity
MHGNVGEWVEDCYEDDYRARQPSNGRAHSPASCSYRVYRGGSWVISPQYLRSAGRIRYDPTLRIDGLGFRVARTL